MACRIEYRNQALLQSLVVIILSLGLGGCSGVIRGVILRTFTTPTPEPVLADCFNYFHLLAWVDANGDGQPDENEPGLAGVEFFVSGPYAYSFQQGKSISDENGEARIETWSPGECPEDANFSIDAQGPDNYEMTTAAPVVLDGNTQITGTYDFGFRPVDMGP